METMFDARVITSKDSETSLTKVEKSVWLAFTFILRAANTYNTISLRVRVGVYLMHWETQYRKVGCGRAVVYQEARHRAAKQGARGKPKVSEGEVFNATRGRPSK